jgi:hypothetical protein
MLSDFFSLVEAFSVLESILAKQRSWDENSERSLLHKAQLNRQLLMQLLKWRIFISNGNIYYCPLRGSI